METESGSAFENCSCGNPVFLPVQIRLGQGHKNAILPTRTQYLVHTFREIVERHCLLVFDREFLFVYRRFGNYRSADCPAPAIQTDTIFSFFTGNYRLRTGCTDQFLL
ncbi:hypothetical protein D3C86_1769470 [compost metagenome]